MDSYLITKTSLIFLIVIPYIISLTTEERHSLSSRLFQILHLAILPVFTWLLFVRFVMILFNVINQKILFFIFLTFENIRLTLCFPSFSGGVSFTILEAFLEIICLFFDVWNSSLCIFATFFISTLIGKFLTVIYIPNFI